MEKFKAFSCRDSREREKSTEREDERKGGENGTNFSRINNGHRAVDFDKTPHRVEALVDLLQLLLCLLDDGRVYCLLLHLHSLSLLLRLQHACINTIQQRSKEKKAAADELKRSCRAQAKKVVSVVRETCGRVHLGAGSTEMHTQGERVMHKHTTKHTHGKKRYQYRAKEREHISQKMCKVNAQPTRLVSKETNFMATTTHF